MPNIFSALRDTLPRLAESEPLAAKFHSNGRRVRRDPKLLQQADTFITSMETADERRGRTHESFGADATETTDDPDSLEMTRKIKRAILAKADYDPTFKPMLSDSEEFAESYSKAQVELNRGQSDRPTLPPVFGYPILGISLAVDSRQHHSWEYTYPREQYNTAFMKPTDDDLEPTILEATIGADRTLLQNFIDKFNAAKKEADRDFAPSSVSFKVLYTAVHQETWKALAKDRAEETRMKYLYFPKADLNVPGHYVNFPTKILIGTGDEYMASLKIGVKPSPPDYVNRGLHFRIIFGTSCREELDFLYSLGTLVGFHANTDHQALSEFFQAFYPNDDFQPIPVLQLNTLAVASGYKLKDTSTTALCNQITGAIFDDMPLMSPSDKTILPIVEMSQDYVVFILWNLYQTSAVYTILQGTLIRNLFPDPEIVMDMTELPPDELYTWLSQLISQTLSNSDVNQAAYLNATTRKQATLSIRQVRPHPEATIAYKPATDFQVFGSIVQHTEPSHDVVILADMIPSWPTIVHGGARYLHPARSHFHYQYELLRHVSVVESNFMPNLQHVVDNDLKLTTLYQRGLIIQDSGEPAHEPGLLCLPDFEKTIAIIYEDNPALCAELIKTRSGRTHPNQSWTNFIVEWGRLNPTKIPNLFKDLKKKPPQLDSLWINQLSTYDRLKMIMFRVLNIKSVVPALESVLMKREENTLEQELTSLSRVIQKRKNRVARLEHIANRNDFRPRSGTHNRLYKQIPGDNTSRNRKLRARRTRREDVLKERFGANYVGGLQRKNNRRQAAAATILAKFRKPNSSNRRDDSDLRNRLDTLHSDPDYGKSDLRHVINQHNAPEDDVHHPHAATSEPTVKRTVTLGPSATEPKRPKVNIDALIKKVALHNPME